MSLSYIKSLRESIGKLTKWESSGEAFGFIENVSNKNPDYIYEFFCAMSILKDLNKNQSIKLVKGKEGYKFPRKPGRKEDWAKFLIREKGTRYVLFQFCLGTEIKISSSPLTSFGADISLQSHDAPDDPDDSHVILIMDGKYKKSITSKLDIGTIREFAKCVSDMDVPKRSRFKLQFDTLSELNANCLLTNGEGMKDHEQYCKNNKLKQVGRFDCDGKKIVIVG